MTRGARHQGAGIGECQNIICPGSKAEGKTGVTADVPRKRATQARIDVEDGIDSVQNATSMNGETWDEEFAGELEIDNTGDSDTELNAEDARSYRAIAARLNYISPDRADIAYAAQEPRSRRAT